MKQNQCRLCNKSYPDRVLHLGKIRTVHQRGYCFECKPLGTVFRKDRSHIKTKVCSKCNKEKDLELYNIRNRGLGPTDVQSICKECNHSRQKKLRNAAKESYVNYKGGQCQKCSYNKCLAALDFHHKDPSKKEINISKFRWRMLDEGIKKELDKCDLLCANCHREEHYM